jgi:hypothetical protein
MSAVPNNITKEHLLKAIERIDKEGIEKGAHSSTYDVFFEGKRYPPKLVVSWANEFANGEVLDRKFFSGGLKSANFKVLNNAGFEIVEKESKSDDTLLKDFCANHATNGIDLLLNKLDKSQKYILVDTYFSIKKKYPDCDAFSSDGAKDQLQTIKFGVKKLTNKSGKPKVYLGFAKGQVSVWLHQQDPHWDSMLRIDSNTNNLNEWLDSHNEHIENGMSGSGNIPTSYNEEDHIVKIEKSFNPIIQTSLNQILYGPPGTGKTYSTINKALEIIEPEFLSSNKYDREALKERFDSLVKANLIGFVTFHQSFSYEDFVEGIKASTNDNNQVSYDVEDGVFKSICDRASSSVGGVVAADSFDEAVKLLQGKCEEADERIEMKTVRGKIFEIEFLGGSTFKVFPRSTESTDPKYVASIANVRKLYLLGSKDGIYNSSYVEGFLLYLKKHLGVTEPEKKSVTSSAEEQPFVLIIDEINRGNVANIFGELITLIEPSKRAGGNETISVKLPYSKTPFTVPSNLYLIGTMNTADKSLAQVDIALRRRFDFIEMMTDYDVLSEIPTIEGINVKNLVETINQRIELLYDREHTIGHSFFLPLKDEPTIAKLAGIFELQILPLLEEYFFEDWERVGQVLGDHLKPNNDLRFIIEKFESAQVSKLMGSDWELSGIQPYVRNDNALNNPKAYIGIYESAH